MLAWKIAPALAAGNTVVLKPAEYTPLTALAFAEICVEAGLPAGVVNIVTGDGAMGSALARTRASTRSPSPARPRSEGRSARRRPAAGKKLSLELGGKSPFIVFDDADLDSAVEGVVDAIWFNQGQVCCAGSRLLVAGGNRRSASSPSCSARMAKLRVGDPLDKSTDVGAIVSPAQLERIQQPRRRGREGRADRLPRRPAAARPRLLLSADPRRRRRAGVDRWRARRYSVRCSSPRPSARPDEAIALANNTRYGLAASVWTENVNRALEVAARIKAGVVWINSTNLFDAAAGFGGYRESGFGREGGREGLRRISRADAAENRRPRGQAEARSTPRPASRRRRSSAAASTARRSSTSAASRRGPIRAIATPSSIPRAAQIGLAGLGNRKDIRNAVEAAAKASGWGAATAHNRAQVLYYLAENLAARADEFAERLRADDRRRGARARRRKSTPRSAAHFSTPASPTSSTARSSRRAPASSRWR